MRDGWTSRWGWRVSAVVLVGGLLVVGTGTVVTQAGERDDDRHQRNPFERILHKLDKILDAVKGGGGQDGNHTLRWDQVLPAAQRFVILTAFNNEAVLDKNTGLVWERMPDNGGSSWGSATFQCLGRNVGGTRGWRLPSVVELGSLIDLTLPPPFVPATIFTGVEQEISIYWSATSYALNPAFAWEVSFSNGSIAADDKVSNTLPHTWCVRGGMNADAY